MGIHDRMSDYSEVAGTIPMNERPEFRKFVIEHNKLHRDKDQLAYISESEMKRLKREWKKHHKSSVQHDIQHRSGEYGRGLIDPDSGMVHTWPVNEMTHAQKAQSLGYEKFDYPHHFQITPNNSFFMHMLPGKQAPGNDWLDHVSQATGLTPQQWNEELEGGWAFRGAIEHDLQWTYGNPGKAIVTQDGVVHTWNTVIDPEDLDEKDLETWPNITHNILWAGMPHHSDMPFEHNGRSWQYIHPSGEVHGVASSDEDASLVQSLTNPHFQSDSWHLGASDWSVEESPLTEVDLQIEPSPWEFESRDIDKQPKLAAWRLESVLNFPSIFDVEDSSKSIGSSDNDVLASSGNGGSSMEIVLKQSPMVLSNVTSGSLVSDDDWSPGDLDDSVSLSSLSHDSPLVDEEHRIADNNREAAMIPWDEMADNPNAPGMPRPISEHGQYGLLPVPWSQDTTLSNPKLPQWGIIDEGRNEQAQRESLCLVCGQPVERGQVFCDNTGGLILDEEPITQQDLHQPFIVDSGPLHDRCAQLTQAHCPHLRDGVARGHVVLHPYVQSNRIAKIAANQVMYHVAPSNVEKEIKENGLYPALEDQRKWQDRQYPMGVYLHPDFDAQLDEAEAEGGHLWEVDTNGLTLLNDPLEQGSYYSAEPIPPERIRRIASELTQQTQQTYQPPPNIHSSYAGEGHSLGWSPGNYGKALVTGDGQVHTWDLDDNSRPFHMDYMSNNGIDPHTIRGEYDIDPEHNVEAHWGSPEDHSLVQSLVGKHNSPWSLSHSESHTESDYTNNRPSYEWGLPSRKSGKVLPKLDRVSEKLANGVAEGTPYRTEYGENEYEQTGPWKPGSIGKGYITPEGQAVHWRVNEQDEPHHWTIADSLGHSNIRTAIPGIWEDGTVILPSLGTRHDYDDANLLADTIGGKIQDGPWNRNQWTFKSNRSPYGNPEEGDPKVVHLNTSSQWSSENGKEVGRPLIYHHPSNTLYVGPTGSYHIDLVTDHPHLFPGSQVNDQWDYNIPDSSLGRYDNAGIDWFQQKSHKERSIIEKVLGLGTPNWEFQAAGPISDSNLDPMLVGDHYAWNGSEKAKGIVSDGTIHWGPKGRGHYEIAQAAGLPGNYDSGWTPFQIDPDGRTLVWAKSPEQHQETLNLLKQHDSRIYPNNYDSWKLGASEPPYFDFYHYAPTEDRARIQTHGLLASNPIINNPWLGQNTDQPALWGVHAVATPDQHWIANEVLEDKPFDIWKIRAQGYPNGGVPWVNDPHSPGFVFPRNISPEQLELHTPWEHLTTKWGKQSWNFLDPLGLKKRLYDHLMEKMPHSINPEQAWQSVQESIEEYEAEYKAELERQNQREANAPPTFHWHGQPNYEADHSYYYNPVKNEIHIGDSNYHHQNIISEIPDFNDPDYWPGAIYDGILEHYHDNDNPAWNQADKALLELNRQQGYPELAEKRNNLLWNMESKVSSTVLEAPNRDLEAGYGTGEDSGRPFIYDAYNDTTYLGHPHQLHWDVIHQFPDLERQYGSFEESKGAPRMEGRDHGYGRLYERNEGQSHGLWLYHGENKFNAVRNALNGQGFNVEPNMMDDPLELNDESWHIGSIYETEKGLKLKNGQEIWWPPGGENPYTHVEYLLKNNIHPDQVEDYGRAYSDGDREWLKGTYGDFWDKEFNRVSANEPQIIIPQGGEPYTGKGFGGIVWDKRNNAVYEWDRRGDSPHHYDVHMNDMKDPNWQEGASYGDELVNSGNVSHYNLRDGYIEHWRGDDPKELNAILPGRYKGTTERGNKEDWEGNPIKDWNLSKVANVMDEMPENDIWTDNPEYQNWVRKVVEQGYQGGFGKWIDVGGKRIAWNVNEGNENPHHFEVQRLLGLPVTLSNAGYYNHPSNPDEEWKLGATELHHERIRFPVYDEHDQQQSIPIIHDPHQNILYTGPPGSYHWDMIREHPDLYPRYAIEDENGDDLGLPEQEAPAERAPEFNHGRLDWTGNKRKIWWHQTPEEPHLSQINQYMNIDPEDDWTVSKTSAIQLVNGGSPISRFKAGESEQTEPWSLGSYGKGLLHKNTLHLWKPNQRTGDPHHDEVLYGGAANPYATYNNAVAFDITPEGWLETWRDKDRDTLKSLISMHPDFKERPNWTFGKIADTWNAQEGRWIPDFIPDINVKMTDDRGDASREVGDYEFEKRRPLLFDTGDNTLYVGGYNQTHLEAANSHRIMGPWDSLAAGSWVPEGGFDKPPGSTIWFQYRGGNLRPEWEKAIHNKLNGEGQSQDPWNLSKVANQPIIPVPSGNSGYKSELFGEYEPWEFGHPGKGFLDTSTGNATAWKVKDVPDSYAYGPYHSLYGLPLGSNRDNVVPFWISPEGSLSNYGTVDNELQPMLRYHPDLKLYDNNKWEFDNNKWGKIANEGPPKIVELNHDQVDAPSDWDNDYSWLGDRQPFIYHPDEHQVVVGPRGTFHSQIGGTEDDYEHFGALLYPTNKNTWVPSVTSFGGDIPPSVMSALSEKYNLPFEPWKLSASDYPIRDKAIHKLLKKGWHPGSHGKGLLINGKLIHWPVGDDGFGPPHHQHVLDTITDDPRPTDAFVYFNPDGTFHVEKINSIPTEKEEDDLERQILEAHPETRTDDDWDLAQPSPQPVVAATAEETVYIPHLHLTLPKQAAPYDPAVCSSCGGAMSEPHKMGQRWVNNCTRCGLTRDVPISSPLLQQQITNEQFTPYPDLLNQVNQPKERPWIFGANALRIVQQEERPEWDLPGWGEENFQNRNRIGSRPFMYYPNIHTLGIGAVNGHHHEIADSVFEDPDDQEQFDPDDNHFSGYITSDGRLKYFDDPDLLPPEVKDNLQQITGKPTKNWNLAKTASIIPEVSQQEPRPNDVLGDRIPVLWYPNVHDPHYNDTVWEDRPSEPTQENLLVGQPGMTHSELEHEIGNYHHPLAPEAGVINLNNNKFNWLTHYPVASHDRVIQALQQHHPGLIDDTEEYNAWRFGKEAGILDYYYHVAPRSERDRIMAHGLHPGRPTWDNYPPEKLDRPSPRIVNQPPGIYVSRSPIGAQKWKWGLGDKDIWRIPRSAVGESYPDPIERGSLYITHPVPAELHQEGERDENNAWYEHINYPQNQNRPHYYPDQEKPPVFGWGGGEALNIERNPQWGIGKPNHVWGKTSHLLNWDEGNEGKAVLLDDGTFHTWNVDDVRMPNHVAYMRENGLQPQESTGFFEINPEGKLFHADAYNPEAAKQVALAAELDPRLSPAEGSHWDIRGSFDRIIPNHRWSLV